MPIINNAIRVIFGIFSIFKNFINLYFVKIFFIINLIFFFFDLFFISWYHRIKKCKLTFFINI